MLIIIQHYDDVITMKHYISGNVFTYFCSTNKIYNEDYLNINKHIILRLAQIGLKIIN